MRVLSGVLGRVSGSSSHSWAGQEKQQEERTLQTPLRCLRITCSVYCLKPGWKRGQTWPEPSGWTRSTWGTATRTQVSYAQLPPDCFPSRPHPLSGSQGGASQPQSWGPRAGPGRLDMSLSQLWEVVKDWEAWRAAVCEVTESKNLVTE